MTQKPHIDPAKVHFERQLYLNHQVLRTIEAVYRSHGQMVAVNYEGSDGALIQVNIYPLSDAQRECAIVLLGMPNHRFEVMCFHRATQLAHFNCTSAALNGPRLARFFSRLQTSIVTTLAKAEASPVQAPEAKGFVQRVKDVVQVKSLSCYEITLHNGKVIAYQHPEDVPMKIVPGGWLYGDGEGSLEYFSQRAPH